MGSTEVVVAIFGISIVFGNDLFFSVHAIPDDLFRFHLMTNVLQDSLTTVCVLEFSSELSLLIILWNSDMSSSSGLYF